MPREETVIDSARVKYRGVFDLSLVYDSMKFWLLDIGFSEPKETKYVEKVKPGGKDIIFIWDSSKEEESGFFKLAMNIKFYAVRINETESETESGKLKLHKGDLWITFSSKLVVNANGKWDDHSLTYKVYEKYLMKDKINHYKIEFYNDTNKIMSELKNFLNLYYTV